VVVIGLPGHQLPVLIAEQKPGTKVDRQCAGLCSLGMKINAKLGGINVRLAGSQQEAMPHIGRKPVMFLGKPLLSSHTRSSWWSC
jgi:hypothetical protein